MTAEVVKSTEDVSLETVQNYVETVFRVFLTVFHFFYDFPFKKGRDLNYHKLNSRNTVLQFFCTVSTLKLGFLLQS